jgi:hypothetical protein
MAAVPTSVAVFPSFNVCRLPWLLTHVPTLIPRTWQSHRKGLHWILRNYLSKIYLNVIFHSGVPSGRFGRGSLHWNSACILGFQYAGYHKSPSSLLDFTILTILKNLIRHEIAFCVVSKTVTHHRFGHFPEHFAFKLLRCDVLATQ